MCEKFTKQTLKIAVARICQTIGWHAIQTTPLEIMVDVLNKYLEQLVKTTHLYSDQFGRTRPNLNDLGLAFSDLGISLRELEEYVQFVDPVPLSHAVPQYPVPKDSHLNFLKPGSKEVVTRPVHVHEHLPPTIIENNDDEESPLVVDAGVTANSSPQQSPQGVFKRPGDPLENPALKRVRVALEEEGRPLREISSVMMTTGGFLSPAREGKLPEPKVVMPMSDSRPSSPQIPSYPTVPPEVNRQKKKKSSSSKDKERRKEKHKSDDVKKLASMKELAKLKAIKTGVFKKSHGRPPKPKKHSLPTTHPPTLPSSVVNSGEKSLIQKLTESPHLVVTPVKPTTARPNTPTYDRLKDPGVTIAKLSTEPDKQKLNIFKKISKVKEEKVEKHDFSDMVIPTPRERSPGLIIEELPPKRSRSALGDLIDMMPKERNQSPILRPRTPDIQIEYDQIPPSPGSPSIPRTPDILKRSPEHKKKKRDKEKKKKNKTKDKKLPVHEDIDNERPKTPEIIETKPVNPTPSFPFFSQFSPAPGLIPSPISNNPLIRAPLLHTSAFPHLAKPNLSLPPAAFMQTPLKQETNIDVKREKTSPSISPTFSKTHDKDGKSPLSVLLSRDKEEKKKEHKKEKKEKLKKKKKEKNKDKGEKKHKEHKHKQGEKKEKKEKKKEKVKEEKESSLTPVPKLTLKLNHSSPEATPSPIPEVKPEREPSPEVARISSLFSKPSISNKPPEVKLPVTKQLHIQTTDTPKPPNTMIKSPGTSLDKDGNRVWICPACGRQDDGTPMIGCDECDAWYHWVCVGIQVPPDENEDWYCRFCIVKKQGSQQGEKKKRGRKKKPPV